MNKSILIVDDETGILELLKFYLSEHGYVAHITTDARKALRLLESICVDLIITDIVMPEMEGIEFINEVRRERHDVKIIAMSGGNPSLDKTIYLDVASAIGADAVMTKPFNLDSVLALVQKLI